ncbi:hypothetical protein [Streptomyces sp. T028]|uniref:hypothetical protein n=1 Tax=Streptomyces sp. T028 TaxID=3394379 RepID=UPI003A8AA5E5
MSDDVWPSGEPAPSSVGRRLTPDERREYAGDIESLGSIDSPELRFRHYRDGRLLLVGAGPVAATLLKSALRTGCRDIEVLCTDPPAAGGGVGLAGLIEDARRDGAQKVGARSDLDGLAARDTVLQVSGSVPELVVTADRCADAGALLGQVLISGEEMWTGPVGSAARTAAASAWRRLRGIPLTGPAVSSLAGRPAELAAEQLLRAWFECATGTTRPSGSPYLLRTDLRTGTVVPHRFLPLPAGSTVPQVTEAQARAAFLGRLNGAAVDADVLFERVAAVADPRAGLVGVLEEREAAAGPLARWECRTTVADAFGARPAGTPDAVVTGHGGDRETARLAALLAALANYGSLAGLSLAAGSCARIPDVWGLDLVTGALRRIPARVARPAPDKGASYRPPVGVAAGLTWAHAVEAGLAQHCEELLSRRLADPGLRVPRLYLPADEAPGAADPLYLLRTLGEPVAHDLSAVLSVPACAIRLGSRTVVAVGATHAEAVRTAAERAVLARRSSARTVPAITPEQERPAPFFPGMRTVAGGVRFVEALRAQGRTPVAVLLDRDPQAVVVLPYVVQVILTEE